MSIDEIVRRHSGALSQAETSAREKARLQIARDSPLPASIIGASTHFETLQSPRVPTSPIIIDRRSSTPNVKGAPISLHTSSLTSSSENESPTSTSSSDVLQRARLGQALLNRLESRSIDSTPSRSSGASKVSVTLISERVATPVTENHQLDATTNTGKAADQSQELALYLRSPHLNRFLDLPRPFPKRPLRVSYSEVGAPEGYPVLVFLGLGCVRYLMALFDEIATAFNLRLICIDRWGFGRTDQVSKDSRTCAEWAKVVSKILDELSIDKCQIIAHSAGAPYAGAVALRLGKRVKGRLHFLAPWVSADIDGYKWLKYIPNGLIKGAIAAEWQLQSYMLGKAPRVSYAPVENPVRSPSPSLGRRTSLLLRRTSTKSLSPKTAPTGGLGRSPRLGNLKSFQHRSYSVNSVPTRSSYTSDQTPSSTSTELLSPLTPILGDSKFLTDDFGLGAGFDSFATSLGLALPCPVTSKHESYPMSKPPMSPALTQALMQASHAESEPGTTSDLLSIVLNRPARTLGFSYSDLTHPAVVWYGSEDERVGEKGMRWLERSLTAGCELRIKQGESHNLMTSSQVMWEVFESVAREARGIA
ncbi:hypothetical protein BCR39DRAFT_468464 [Naematelia encephala]|uniref:Alpha/Beta hydrolase protein n=1 Tax=Naematelia encephala TaxID=71784 RepID=A0A1Y2B1A2_9TREE|nr:hypothetical protein BCR39DRAFT_468464 [Naematelia encephala]